MRGYFDPLARALVALIFLISGWGKLMHFSQTAGFMGHTGFPMPEFFLVGAIVVELIGGLMLLIGFRARWAALVMFLYLIPATIIFHAAHGQMLEVEKNLAIMGGLLKFWIAGAGAFSLDNSGRMPTAESRT